jgi:hypothetical protein
MNGMEKAETNHEDMVQDRVYLAALRATAPLFPVVAVVNTVVGYLWISEYRRLLPLSTAFESFAGGFVVIVGILVAIFTWLVVAFFYRVNTSADHANPRNYDLLRQNLARLNVRLEHAHLEEGHESAKPSDATMSSMDDLNRVIRQRAYSDAVFEYKEIDRGLRSSGMPWVRGTGYIDLWRRVHRAEEALIKLEPYPEALTEAMRDEERLIEANMRNRELLLRRLRMAAAVLDDSEGTVNLTFLAESANSALAREEPVTPENRIKALAILSEVRYEINNFRDNILERIVAARNSLTDTSVLLSIVAYALLGLAIFVSAPTPVIIWVVTYFLVGATMGLFAQARTAWNVGTATDEFDLSTTRLLHIPWLSGLAAVGGVFITSVLIGTDGPSTFSSAEDLITIFDGSSRKFIIAAIFGLAPDLLIRRLAEQVEGYKADLQSTEITRFTDPHSGGPRA